MKKIIITLLTMCFIMTGCFGADKALKERNQAQQPAAVSLTLENVSKAILAEGLELMPTAIPEKDWILNKVEPNRFQVGSPKENTDPAKLEQISIYVFVSENDRNKG